MTDLSKLTVAELRQIIHDGSDIYGPGSDSDHLAFAAALDELARKAQANDALRKLISWALGEGDSDFPSPPSKDAPRFYWRSELRRRLNDIDNVPAPSSSGAPAPDHVAGVSKMVPVFYHLDDGKVAAAMLVAKNTLVVDLMSGDGPSVVGRDGWFDAGYVATYGGLVPEAADEGTEPGQWSYGVRQLPQFLAPADSQREAAIEAWIKSATDTHASVIHRDGPSGCEELRLDDVFEVHATTINEGLALMRSAPPAPVTRFDDVKSHARRLLTAWWQDPDVDGINPDVEVQKQFVREAKRFFRMVLAIDNAAPPEPPAPPAPVAPVTEGDRWRQLAEVKQVRIDRLKEDLHAAQEEVEKLRAPVAPVTDAEVEAAIRAYRSECIAPPDDDACEDEAFGYLRSLIARRVAEARGAGLREFKAWFAEKATWTIEATAEAPAVRGYSVAPRDIDTQIDRLLAAPPASKLAEEPAQEPWREKLRVATNRMADAAGYAASSSFSDVDYDLKDVRDFAFALREQVESQARRIEALENNKEAGK